MLRDFVGDGCKVKRRGFMQPCSDGTTTLNDAFDVVRVAAKTLKLGNAKKVAKSEPILALYQQ